jgi:hypothetical protein
MCFVAVNGKPRKTLGNTSNYMYMKFSEWSAAGYPDTGTISQFKPRLRNTILDVASFISETQEYIFSNEFLFKNGANK